MQKLSLLLGLLYFMPVFGQRNYADNSVLNQGDWFRFAVQTTGIYKIDGKTLKEWGVNINSLSSNLIRIYGNGGGSLPEANVTSRYDDLIENNIWIVDGGDGVFNENDYLLFYATAPDGWIYESFRDSWKHQKNLYSKVSYYYLTTGGEGRRVPSVEISAMPVQEVSDFEDRFFYENNAVNFLKSGKEWFGEEFALAPGKKNSIEFSLNFPHLQTSAPLRLRSSVASRSIGATGRFLIYAEGQQVMEQSVPSTSADQYARIVRTEEEESSFSVSQSTFKLRYDYSTASVGGTGWLNWFEIFAQRALDMSGINQLMYYYSAQSAGEEVVEFNIQNADATVMVWDITNPQSPKWLKSEISGSLLKVKDRVEGKKSYIAFRPQNFLSVNGMTRVENQNLHALSNIDYIIVTYPDFLTEANRLAQWHQSNNGLKTAVVTTHQVYQEFGSGIADPAAIRDFVKMLYDRSKTTSSPLRYLLLFGDGSYDYLDRISGNTNYVPAYQSSESIDPLQTYTSDDFYGFLDDKEDINDNFINLLDIGIGRIPAKSIEEARAVVNKIIHFHEPASYGSWRNEITLVADDEDLNSHLSDAEFHAEVIENKLGKTPSKIYLDAYRQQSGSGGSRYPEANVAVNNKILSGTLIWNYSGHGGFRRLAEEVILDNDVVNTWNNADRLPLIVAATCDFAPYDNPQINSLGESMLLRDKQGAIALMTTTRVVFQFSNRIINNNFFKEALKVDSTGAFPSLGTAIRRTKNLTYSTFADVVNNRKFTLLGDPAMQIGLTENKVRTISINEKPFGSDTLQAFSKYEIKGEVTDKDGNKRSNFNGDVYPVIYDKPQTVATLANDADSRVAEFKVQTNVLFKGKTKAENGSFSYTFIVPKDINYSYGNGLISYYAYGNRISASGNEQNIIIGGIGATDIKDENGPLIKAYMNDEKFVDGGITNENPVLLLKLFDSSGINSAGAGIGHDISAIIDDDINKYYVLNDFYTTESGSYQRGSLRFQLPALSEGQHFVNIKVWDVFNNSSNYRINFKVVKDQELQIANVYNYPNPFTTSTRFMFEHNRPGDLLQVNIRIFSVAGNLVKSISQTINATGNRSFDIDWNGTDHFGRKLGRGVYIYDVEIKDSRGKRRTARQKLVLL